ncbi:hypothetical protein OVA14_03510 [Agrococcus sp. SL85]|uniref:hypothetical protein n=1 Tax=Agrococcus sp. SL85 TaxID=2995141 RepID=UPI00226D3F48|nr:hypothetical protein [Agrococcus sp. SL85]WAC66850.1 hypothetical protein OVA14_03510 [Agrococcus sp. SL85]
MDGDERDELRRPLEVEATDVSVADDEGPSLADAIREMTEEQRQEAEEFAAGFLKRVIRLRGVRIEREQFLKAELHKRGFSQDVIAGALAENPAAAGIPPAMLDSIAMAAIEFETRKSTMLSFAAGLPGGLLMIGTIPGDITQFYIHAFRIMQKLAYVYGWQSFLEDAEEIDDETLGMLATFLGVMMGVGGASASLTAFAANVARPAVQRQIAGIALTKTAWYTPMKQILRVIGVQLTKDSFAKAASKVVPVIGGVVSGTMTYVMLGVQSRRLQQHLRELPPPGVDAAEYLLLVRRADEESEAAEAAGEAGFGAARERALAAVSDVSDFFRPVDLDGDGVPDEARALTAIKDAGATAKGLAEGAGERLGSLFKRKRDSGAETADASDSETNS